MQCFSTRGLPTPQAKIDYLKQVMSVVFTNLDVKPDRPDEFEHHIDSTRLGRLSIAHATTAPAHVIRRHGVEGTGEHLYFLHTQLQGRMHARQDGREGVLEPGDMVLCDTAAPYDLGLSGQCRTLILGIPASDLARRVASPNNLLGLRLPGDSGPMRMVRALMVEMWGQLRDADSLPAAMGDRLGDTVLDLFATACHMRVGAACAEGTVADGHRTRIRRLVEARLFDPDLGPDVIAATLGLSPRYLRLLVSGDGESLSAYILRRRLEECARRLGDPHLAARSVTEIAFDCGFNDASYFSRTFKARYGRSPRDYRHAPD